MCSGEATILYYGKRDKMQKKSDTWIEKIDKEKDTFKTRLNEADKKAKDAE